MPFYRTQYLDALRSEIREILRLIKRYRANVAYFQTRLTVDVTPFVRQGLQMDLDDYLERLVAFRFSVNIRYKQFFALLRGSSQIIRTPTETFTTRYGLVSPVLIDLDSEDFVAPVGDDAVWAMRV